MVKPPETHETPPLSESTSSKSLDIWLGICSVCLVGATAGLWFPAWMGADFPASPLLSSLAPIPLGVDCWLSIVLISGWLLLAFASCLSLASPSTAARRNLVLAASVAVLIAGSLLVLLNQHRLQPWHYQGLLFLLILRTVPGSRKLKLLRWLTVSIYFYSAVSKFDFQFAHTVGQDLMRASVQLLPGLKQADPAWWLVWAIPAVELLVALLLAFSRTHRLGAWIACGLHTVLILILGPLGLGHSLGVLLWNAHFIGIVVLLFIAPEPANEQTGQAEPPLRVKSRSTQAAAATASQLIVYAVMLLPLVERFGFWDHWPSWALYAPHSSRVELRVSTTSVTRLPESLQQQIGDFREEDLWVRVPLASWSLEQTGAPIYPQARFQWAVAIQIAERIDSEYEIQAECWPSASRWTGERDKVVQSGASDILQYASHFRLGCQPRQSQVIQSPSGAP